LNEEVTSILVDRFDIVALLAKVLLHTDHTEKLIHASRSLVNLVQYCPQQLSEHRKQSLVSKLSFGSLVALMSHANMNVSNGAKSLLKLYPHKSVVVNQETGETRLKIDVNALMNEQEEKVFQKRLDRMKQSDLLKTTSATPSTTSSASSSNASPAAVTAKAVNADAGVHGYVGENLVNLKIAK
jgi:hypothetical protein